MRIKKETNGRGAICIDAVGYEAIGHAGDGDGNNNKGHDHSKVSNPAYEPANPLQVINWMCQTAKKYSTISIPGVYGSAYDKFPILFRSHVRRTRSQPIYPVVRETRGGEVGYDGFLPDGTHVALDLCGKPYAPPRRRWTALNTPIESTRKTCLSRTLPERQSRQY